MKATSTTHQSAHDPHSPPVPKASPLRLMILLGILAVVAGALVYDKVIAPPQVQAAYDTLQDKVFKLNERGVRPVGKPDGDQEAASTDKSGSLLYSEDIQKILGMKPSTTDKTELYTIEYYRWWGWVPRNQNCITVLYIGDNPDKRHYSTHYANGLPEDVLLPGKSQVGPPVVEPASDPTVAVAKSAEGKSPMPEPPMPEEHEAQPAKDVEKDSK